MKRILIVHPSRGRPELALATLENHIGNSSGQHPITYIYSCDVDDPSMERYRDWLGPAIGGFLARNGFRHVTGQTVFAQNHGIVQAVNRVYSRELLGRHDFVVLTSDDMRMPAGWDASLVEVFDKVGYDKAVKTCQPEGNPDLITLQIAGASFFLDYGTFFWPEYVSVYADNDFTEWAKMYHRYVRADHIVCPHLHPIIKLPENVRSQYGDSLAWDETYGRENSNYAYGQQVFKGRIANRFSGYVLGNPAVTGR